MDHSTDFPASFYRVAVKALIVRDGKILLVHEPPEMSGQWELPGGGLDFGEPFKEGLRREIKEETGLLLTTIADRPTYSWVTKFEHRRDMDWYYSLVLAFQAEVASLDFSTSPECDDMQFFSPLELQTLDLFRQALPLRNMFNPEHFA